MLMAATTTNPQPILALRDARIVQGEDARVEHLAFDLQRNELKHAILTTKDGVIVDGWLREQACRRIGRQPSYLVIPLSLDALIGGPPASVRLTAEIIRHLWNSAAATSAAGLWQGVRSRRAQMVRYLVRSRLRWDRGTSIGSIEKCLRLTGLPEAISSQQKTPRGADHAQGRIPGVEPPINGTAPEPGLQPLPQPRLKLAAEPGPEDMQVQEACLALLNAMVSLIDGGKLTKETESTLRMTHGCFTNYIVTS